MEGTVNISAYRFVELSKIKTLQVLLKAKCESLGLLGTILLGHEGVNMNLAGQRATIDRFIDYLTAMPEFIGMQFKESLSGEAPFEKLVVRIKDEIVTMREDGIHPEQTAGDYVSPETFKAWLDEQEDMLVLDTRNRFEAAFGSFDGAEVLPIDNFSEFPAAVEQMPADAKEKTVVTFCTGGIRCEKAVLAMHKAGFKKVYQLAGGILNYFEQCGAAHYHGECFVFDERISLDGDLKETGTVQCKQCFGPVTKQQGTCPKCLQH